MDKAYRTEFRRKFLIEALPEPLTRASRHLQLFDNYIANTRLRIRSVRDPETKAWTWILQQRTSAETGKLCPMKVAEIHFNEAEHAVFETFEGEEIRKNRYFHDFDGMSFAFDLYLGRLWGLNIASVEFTDLASLDAYEPPRFAIYEITNDQFFLGENLVSRKFEDVQAEVEKIGPSNLIRTAMPDE